MLVLGLERDKRVEKIMNVVELVVRQKSILQQEPAISVTFHVVGPFQQLSLSYIGNNLHSRHLSVSPFPAAHQYKRIIVCIDDVILFNVAYACRRPCLAWFLHRPPRLRLSII